jgi:dienelactone hydrolase
VKARFDYEERASPVTSWRCTLKKTDDRYEVHEVTGTVTLKGDDHLTSVEIEYWRTKLGTSRAPAVLVTPILGGGNDIARLIAREFAEAGLHGVIVCRGVKVLTPEWSAAEVEQAIRRGVVARRRALDWLETRPEVDPCRVSAFGVSMGGIVTAVLAPIEPRIHSAVIALAGGDLASVVMESDESRVRAYRDARMRIEPLTAGALEDGLRSQLISDPIHLARFADPSRFLCFVARWDATVPTRSQVALRAALGKPRTFDLPSGHYTAMAYTPFIRAQSTAWLLERMKEPNPRVASPSRGRTP